MPERCHFAPAVEAGWRLGRQFWGRGYATEAAMVSLADGFGWLGLSEIVAFAVESNIASRRVMERIGMHRDVANDFDDTEAPAKGAWKRVLYRIGASDVTKRGD